MKRYFLGSLIAFCCFFVFTAGVLASGVNINHTGVFASGVNINHTYTFYFSVTIGKFLPFINSVPTKGNYSVHYEPGATIKVSRDVPYDLLLCYSFENNMTATYGFNKGDAPKANCFSLFVLYDNIYWADLLNLDTGNRIFQYAPLGIVPPVYGTGNDPDMNHVWYFEGVESLTSSQHTAAIVLANAKKNVFKQYKNIRKPNETSAWLYSRSCDVIANIVTVTNTPEPNFTNIYIYDSSTLVLLKEVLKFKNFDRLQTYSNGHYVCDIFNYKTKLCNVTDPNDPRTLEIPFEDFTEPVQTHANYTVQYQQARTNPFTYGYLRIFDKNNRMKLGTDTLESFATWGFNPGTAAGASSIFINIRTASLLGYLTNLVNLDTGKGVLGSDFISSQDKQWKAFVTKSPNDYFWIMECIDNASPFPVTLYLRNAKTGAGNPGPVQFTGLGGNFTYKYSPGAGVMAIHRTYPSSEEPPLPLLPNSDVYIYSCKTFNLVQSMTGAQNVTGLVKKWDGVYLLRKNENPFKLCGLNP